MRLPRESFLRKVIGILVTLGLVYWTTELNLSLPRILHEIGSFTTPQVYSISSLSSSSLIATSDADKKAYNEEESGDYESLRGAEWYKMMQFVNSNNKACAGKEHLLEILMRAGKTKLRKEDCEQLPYWSEVISLYGDQPIVYGLETCQAYRNSLMWEGFPLEPDPRVAGLFNTGTNEFADILKLNVLPDDNKLDLNAPNGKHTALSNKSWFHNQSYRKSTPIIPFPIVIIRDPYRWMNSMCKRPYKAEWLPGRSGHCPNLVPSMEERNDPVFDNVTSTFKVTVSHPVEEHYESLADMWSTFYREYIDSNLPRLIIRYEDTLFHAEKVTRLVSQCMGLPIPPEFRYPEKPSKGHVDHVSFAQALMKYSREYGRYGALTDDDREYAQNALDPVLMKMFHYHPAPRPREQQIRETIDSLVATSSQCLGREKLIEILLRADVDDVSVKVCDRLPSWSEVKRLYGEEPIVFGLETCRDYQATRSEGNVTLPPIIRVGGLYNTGTNAFVDSLVLNYEKVDDRLDYNMPGWKHDALSDRRFRNNRLTSDIFPILIVRDPLRWMKSMCKLRYNLAWMDGLPGHCPNLVPSSDEAKLDRYRNVTTYEVHQIDRDIDVRYDSLAEMWSKWNLEYFNASFPRLLIRFEDTLFHAEKIMKLVLECVGRPMKQRFHYKLDKAKTTKKSSDFISALETYGKEVGRYDGYTTDDLQYASKALDANLMKAFHYPSVPVVDKGSNHLDFVVDFVNRYPNCRGKERLVEILFRAGKEDMNDTDCDVLPFWSEIEDLYGKEPVIIGLDTCAEYRESVKVNGGLPHPRVGGLFNTGTNAFVESLMLNFEALSDRLDYNLMLGKHSSVDFKLKNNSAWLSPDVLPIILVRDPYRWMASMCKLPYKATWMPGLAGHCPNLVPSSFEAKTGPYRNVTTFEVQIRDAERYDSLADMWSTWYQQYASATFPRLIIRFEDTLFHLEKVMSAVLDCLGEPMTSAFRYKLEKAKSVKKSSDFFTAVAKYGREGGRYDGMTARDRDYAKKALDPALMSMFRYPPSPFEERGTVDLRIARLVSRYVTCQGKERLLGILLRAGKEEISLEDCEMLPEWDEVASLYGEKPVVLGLETCERFRSNLKELNRTGNMVEPFVRVAGLFNTGTNALSQSFSLNIKHVDDPTEYDVPAGKHVPSKPIWVSTFAEMNDRPKVLPVVLVRDPMRWMQSMCKLGYNAKWQKGLNGRCPNLVPSEEEESHENFRNISTFNVTVSMKNMRFFDHYKSLADLWTDWNRIYYDFETPRLMVRFEDMLFHAEEVMKLITDCAGVPMEKPFLYQVESAKKDARSSADFLTALAKYGRRYGRLDGLFPRDMEYLRQALDPELMSAFHYLNIGQTSHKNIGEEFEEDHR